MKIKYNKIQCRLCGDIIESKFTHDFKLCYCEKVGIDGGLLYLKRVGNKDDYYELSEYYPEPLLNDLKIIKNYLKQCEDLDRALAKYLFEEPDHIASSTNLGGNLLDLAIKGICNTYDLDLDLVNEYLFESNMSVDEIHNELINE